MDYKKKYEEALERAKEIIECSKSDTKEVRMVLSFFPELAESEGERIRKEILDYIKTGTYKKDWILWLEEQGEHQDKGEISDGYHTFNELYFYRMLYNAAFFNMLPKEWVHKAKKHHDGEDCFGGGWFIVMANLPTGQISNHYELKDWDLFQVPEKEVADKWDGHTPQEAADRLHKYLLEKKGEQKPAEWSEEDERIKNNLLSELFNLSVRKLIKKETEKKYASWLKSLRPQSTWKPSDAQMEVLVWCKPLFTDPKSKGILESLIDDLKNL